MPVERRPVTPDESEAIKCLQTVRYTPASFDKRFARDIEGATEITEKQAGQVWRIFKRYRRQIVHPRKGELLGIAEQLAAKPISVIQKL